MQGFMEWLGEWGKPEIIWFVIGLVLIISEFAMPGLIIIFFGFGAILTAILCIIFDFSLNIQLLLFTIFSLASLLLLRKYLKNIFYGKIKPTATDLEDESEYVGRKAVVVSKIEAGGEGKIELDGSHWSATSNETIDAGTRVKITAHKNLTMKVKPD